MIYVACFIRFNSLSAEHDGTGNACSGSDAFIMSATSVIVDNTNPWKFSSCSTNYFTTYINLLNRLAVHFLCFGIIHIIKHKIAFHFNVLNTPFVSLYSQNRNCMTSLSATFDPTALNQYTSLPGQVYDPDSICRHILGSASSFCKVKFL